MSGPTFRAGRDNKGAFATGNFAIATATLTEEVVADPSVDIARALGALRNLLATVPGIETKALTRLDEAKQEAANPAPKRHEVRSLVTQAAAYAREAAGFAEAADKLEPHLKQIAAWIGTSWQSWAPMLGIG